MSGGYLHYNMKTSWMDKHEKVCLTNPKKSAQEQQQQQHVIVIPFTMQQIAIAPTSISLLPSITNNINSNVSLSSCASAHLQKRCLQAFKEITSPFGCMTKVICTLGPSTDSKEMIDKLLAHGMTVAQLNFSHAGDDYTYPTKLMELVQNAPGWHIRLIA